MGAMIEEEQGDTAGARMGEEQPQLLIPPMRPGARERMTWAWAVWKREKRC